MPSESHAIAQFLRAFEPACIPVPPGDDCAVLPPTGDELCVTTDAVVENVHFVRPQFSWEDIGHKALAVNLSDLAAMGAKPAWFVCAIAARRPLTRTMVRGLARGMSALARQVDIPLVGGNFTAARELSLTVTAAGVVPKGRALVRSGARVGDRVYVSGMLGEARLGLALMQRELYLSALPGGARAASQALLRQRRPQPRIALGLLARRYASAALDLSDGLAQDAGHLTEASGVRLVLTLAHLPVSPALAAVQAANHTARTWAWAGGEDYELLLTVPSSQAKAFERACARAGEQVTQIGAVTRGRGVVAYGKGGAQLPLRGGYEHFAGKSKTFLPATLTVLRSGGRISARPRAPPPSR